MFSTPTKTTSMDLLKGIVGDHKADIIADLRGILLNSDRSYHDIGKEARVYPETIEKWVTGETKSPQLLKVLAVANALGYDLMLVKRRRH